MYYGIWAQATHEKSGGGFLLSVLPPVLVLVLGLVLTSLDLSSVAMMEVLLINRLYNLAVELGGRFGY